MVEKLTITYKLNTQENSEWWNVISNYTSNKSSELSFQRESSVNRARKAAVHNVIYAYSKQSYHTSNLIQ